jgi:uncharacterized protein YndB with AHSA1/START domain
MAAEGVEGQATVHIQAPPEKVYAMISDVTRMGEWSPETHRCEWIDGATGPTAGARFKGSNKRGILRWSTKPTVTVADAGNEFTFEVGAPGKEDTRWSYKLTPKDGGTDLTESFESLRYTLLFRIVSPPKRRKVQLQKGVETTLERIKQAAEGSA